MVATCANRLVAASAGSSQQNHTLKAMVFRYLANGSDDQDEAIRNNLQTLLFHMTALEKEMSALNVYVLTQDMQGKPLNLWPKFEQLPSLAATSQELEDTIKRVKALVQAASFSKCCITMYTFQAREISIKVSNTIANVMKTMSDNTKDIETEAEAYPQDSTDQDTALPVVMAELAEVIKHLTAAAEITWAAMNLLESMLAKSSIGRGNTITKIQPYVSWVCYVVTAILACVALFKGHHGALQIPGLNDMTSFVSGMQSVSGQVNSNRDFTAQPLNATLAEFNQRFETIELALVGNTERIDNVWEALGPPNAQGAYFAHNTVADEGKYSGGRISDLHEILMKRIDKLEADALEFKRQVQRSEVRMASRMKKLDRKHGGSGETEVE